MCFTPLPPSPPACRPAVCRPILADDLIRPPNRPSEPLLLLFILLFALSRCLIFQFLELKGHLLVFENCLLWSLLKLKSPGRTVELDYESSHSPEGHGRVVCGQKDIMYTLSLTYLPPLPRKFSSYKQNVQAPKPILSFSRFSPIWICLLVLLYSNHTWANSA